MRERVDVDDNNYDYDHGENQVQVRYWLAAYSWQGGLSHGPTGLIYYCVMIH